MTFYSIQHIKSSYNPTVFRKTLDRYTTILLYTAFDKFKNRHT